MACNFETSGVGQNVAHDCDTEMFNTETNAFGVMPENNQALECPSSFSPKE